MSNQSIILAFLLSTLFFSVIHAQQLNDCGQISSSGFISMEGDTTCGFYSSEGNWVNECSSCGSKIAFDNCEDAVPSSLCALDGFLSTLEGYSNDLAVLTLGFCGPGTGTHNNVWIPFIAQSESVVFNIEINCPINSSGIQIAISETDCTTSYTTIECFGGASAGIDDDITIISDDLIIGEVYYLMMDGFAAADSCTYTIHVEEGVDPPFFDLVYSLQPRTCDSVIVNNDLAVLDNSWLYFELDLEYELYFADSLVTSGDMEENAYGVFFINGLSGLLGGDYLLYVKEKNSCCSRCFPFTTIENGESPEANVYVSSSNDIISYNNPVSLKGESVGLQVPIDNEKWFYVNELGDSFCAEIEDDSLTVTAAMVQNWFPDSPAGEVAMIYKFEYNDYPLWCDPENGYYTDTIRVPYENLTVSLDELSSINASVYPNPSSVFTTIQFEHNAHQLDSYSIFDIQGKEVFTARIPKNALSFKIDVGAYEQGVYILRLDGAAVSYHQKLSIYK